MIIDLTRSIINSDPHIFLRTLESKKLNNITINYDSVYIPNHDIDKFMLSLYLVWKHDFSHILINNFYEISKIIDGEDLKTLPCINPMCYDCKISKYCTIKNNKEYKGKFDNTGCPGLKSIIEYILRNI